MRKLMLMAVAIALVMIVFGGQRAVAAGPTYHIVHPGDTLASIAWRYGMSTWAIANANRLWNPDYIYVGQVLVIPYSSYSILNSVPPSLTESGCGVRVNYGDTLSSIAARLGMDAWSIARANGIYNLNWIYAGQWLRIPNCTPVSSAGIRRTITGHWTRGGLAPMFQLNQAPGCLGRSCAVQGQYFYATPSTPNPVSGSVDIYTGSVSLTILGATPQYFNSVISADSRTMTGQLTGAGTITFTKN